MLPQVIFAVSFPSVRSGAYAASGNLQEQTDFEVNLGRKKNDVIN